MADYRLANLLPLDTFRRILGYNQWHFWGLADNNIVPVTSSCNDWLSKYAWQNTDAMGRVEIEEAIINAEFRLAEQLGYYPATAYFEETLPYPKFHDKGLWNMSHGDSQGRWMNFRVNHGHVEAVEPETRTLIATAAITYTDQESDGLVTRLRGEFHEMPGLLLTSAQAARLCSLEASLCERLLGALVDARVLARTADGRFGRRDQA